MLFRSGLASPVISTVGAWAIYSQSLRLLQVVGGVVVLAGLTGIMLDHRGNRARPVPETASTN